MTPTKPKGEPSELARRNPCRHGIYPRCALCAALGYETRIADLEAKLAEETERCNKLGNLAKQAMAPLEEECDAIGNLSRKLAAAEAELHGVADVLNEAGIGLQEDMGQAGDQTIYEQRTATEGIAALWAELEELRYLRKWLPSYVRYQRQLKQLEAERDEARGRLESIAGKHKNEPGCVECAWCGEDWPCETRRLATEKGKRDG